MDFIFAFGQLPSTLIQKIKKETEFLWGDVNVIDGHTFKLYYPKSQSSDYLVESSDYIGCVDGWGGCLDAASFQQSVQELYDSIRREWPLSGDNISGNFSGLLYERAESRLRIFSDLSGILPLYFSVHGNYILGGTSLILLGRIFLPEIDVVGVVQRISPPDYVNYGTRTILKNLFRILPGEMRIYDVDLILSIKYDNDLYHPGKDISLAESAWNLWEIIKSDVLLSVMPYDKVHIGMSGGWDSRIIAGALSGAQKDLSFLTYGMFAEEYEVRIARKCAQILGADFFFSDIYPAYFPERSGFVKNMQWGEGTLVTPLLTLLPKTDDNEITPILLGDMFEAIVGRNIKSLTSRKSRQDRFLNILSKDAILLDANAVNWEGWSKSMVESTVRIQMEQIQFLAQEIFGGQDNHQISEELAEDVKKTMRRISGNNPPYAMLYDELMAWYTHGSSMGRQFLTLKQSYTPIAATMGFRTIRETAGINPILRADGRLLHEIQRIPELRDLSRLPSAAIPFIPSSSPLWIKDLVWGARSSIDQVLIRNAIRKRSLTARQRVIKTIDYARLYRHPDAQKRVASWFSGRLFTSSEKFMNIVRDRASLAAWPFINNDIVGPASTSILLDLIYS